MKLDEMYFCGWEAEGNVPLLLLLVRFVEIYPELFLFSSLPLLTINNRLRFLLQGLLFHSEAIFSIIFLLMKTR